jgi:23S rRNA pseudouridine1911/1915/1917 synthase
MAAADMLTFPAGALGVDPVRLPIIAREEGWLALNKPAGLAVGADPLEAQHADLVSALSAAITAGKPQLAKLGISYVGRVHGLDAVATGVAVLALSPAAETDMRNAVGSQRWEFVYDVLAQTGKHAEDIAIACDLPLARHATEPRMIVSRATGKKCATHFTPARSLGRWTLWEARTRDNRPHQVRVHASERDLRVPGESTYGSVPRVFLSDLKSKYRAGRDLERPLHPSIAMHLREVRFTTSGGVETHVTTPRPKSFEVLLRRLAEAVSAGPRELRF